jgi:hypothetical protein
MSLQVKPPSKRNSQTQSKTFDIDEKTMDRLTRSPKEKKATDAFLAKQRTRASSRNLSSHGVSPLSSKSQAELDRRPLSPLEVEAMLLGAPYFSVRKSAEQYRSEVTFRGGNIKASLNFPADYEGFGHATFEASTLSRTRKEEVIERPSSNHGTEAIRPAGGLVEVPSMLTANGLDTGAVGFEHFLQIPIGDDVVLQDNDVLEKRKQLHLDPEWLGLRALNMDHLINRLTEMGELYSEIKQHQWESPAPWNRSKLEEMGEDLFDKLLSAELGTTSAGTGSVTAKSQVAALQRVLNTKSLWRDFSNVEWRARIGQLLWSPEDFEEFGKDGERLHSERDVLILQITLAAELFMRILALEALSSSFPPIVTQDDCEMLESQRGTKIKWDLVLAERFLDNLNISAKVPPKDKDKTNRSSFFSAISFFSAKEEQDDGEQSVQPMLYSRNETEQLEGLTHFAEAIDWPHTQDVKTELESKLSRSVKEQPVSSAASIYATPLSSPKFPSTPGNRNSFFGFSERGQRPGFSRKTTAQSISLWPARNIAGNVESFEVGGWLSRSWLSGLVMPGEAARHFLISALLENSPQAITALGEEANLYGGFVYKGKSFWSKSCVVGRVLAARRGTKECMGWISVPGTEGLEDGWLGVDVRESPSDRSKPRIKSTETVEKDSDPIKGNKIESLQAGDFARPSDGPLVMGNEVKFEGLTLTAASDDDRNGTPQETAKDSEADAIASLTFSSPINSKLDKLAVPLTYDVHFVSSYPCHPQITRSRAQSRPLTPSPQLSFENKEDAQKKSSPDKKGNETPEKPDKPWVRHTNNISSSSTSSFQHKEKELPSLPAHPLHIDFQFTTVPVATLLSIPESSRPRALSTPTERKMSVATSGAFDDEASQEVVVLDCRGDEDLQLFARAWCSKVGESALIGKSGRTCLACCVREARALGLGVIIRI